jgi:hypothetical protein
MKPIKPSDVIKHKEVCMPDGVIEVFNALIAQNFRNGRAKVFKDRALEDICSKLGLTEREVYNNNYLEVEDIYRAEGWYVEYDGPAYNETYDAYYVFSEKR